MYTSNELIVLKDTTSGELTKIKPNTEFKLPSGEYLNLNEARLCVNGKTALIIKAGEIIYENKPQGKKKPVRKPKKDIKKIIREEPILVKADNDFL